LCLAPALSHCHCNFVSRNLWSTKNPKESPCTRWLLLTSVRIAFSSRFNSGPGFICPLKREKSREIQISTLITRENHQSNLVKWCLCTAGRSNPCREEPVWWVPARGCRVAGAWGDRAIPCPRGTLCRGSCSGLVLLGRGNHRGVPLGSLLGNRTQIWLSSPGAGGEVGAFPISSYTGSFKLPAAHIHDPVVAL